MKKKLSLICSVLALSIALSAFTGCKPDQGTVEENVSVGGLYSAVKAITNREILRFSLPCEPIKHGSVMQIKEKYGIDGKSIAERIIKKLNEQVL